MRVSKPDDRNGTIVSAHGCTIFYLSRNSGNAKPRHSGFSIPTEMFSEHGGPMFLMAEQKSDDGDGDFGSLETYDPSDDVDLKDFGGGIDKSPDVNEDGEIVSSSSDGEVRDFAMEDDRDVSEDDGGKTETTKTTLDQRGLNGENIFAGSDDVDLDEFAADAPPTWELDATPEDDERGWSYWWECDTGDRIQASKEFGEQSYHVEFLGDGDEYRKLAEGLPSKRDALEVAVGSMEANKCVTPADRHAQGRDRGVSHTELQAQSRADRRAELSSRKLETDNQFEERNELPETYDPTEEFDTDSDSKPAAEPDVEKPYDPTVDMDDVFGGDVPDEETQGEVLEGDDDEDDADQGGGADPPAGRITVPLTKDAASAAKTVLGILRNRWAEIKDQRYYSEEHDISRDDVGDVITEIPTKEDTAGAKEGTARLTEHQYNVLWGAVSGFQTNRGGDRDVDELEKALVDAKRRHDQPDAEGDLTDADAQDEIGEFDKEKHNSHELRYVRELDGEKTTVTAERRDSFGNYSVTSSRFDVSGEDSELITTNRVSSVEFDGNSLEHPTVEHRIIDETENEADRLELQRRAPEGWTVGLFDPDAPEVRWDDGCFETPRIGDDEDGTRFCRFVRVKNGDVRKGARNPKTGEVHTEDPTGKSGGDVIADAVDVMERTYDGVSDLIEEITVGFGTIDAAREYRDEYEEYLHPDDDTREKTVSFMGETPGDVLEDARSEAVQTRTSRGGTHGQVDLTDGEKDELDFSERSVFHARTAKSIALDKGVTEWLDFYDPRLTTDEHVEIYERARKDTASGRDANELDDETVEEKLGEMEAKAEIQQCRQAEDSCEDGIEDACEFLTEECGYTEKEANDLLGGIELKDDDVDVDQDTDEDGLPLRVRIALKKAWRGYRAGRAKARSDGSPAEARKYAGVINSIRRAVGQDFMEFEPAGSFEGGVVEPDDVGEFSPRFETYDPTKELV